jgi:hypothetical protein
MLMAVSFHLESPRVFRSQGFPLAFKKLKPYYATSSRLEVKRREIWT